MKKRQENQKQTETKAPKKSPKEVRKAAGWSLERLAGLADTTARSARIYELSPEAVREPTRGKLARIYAYLESCDGANGGPIPGAPAGLSLSRV